MNKADFWDSNYYNNPPLTKEMIVTAEKELGVVLPEAFLGLLRVQNGGYTRGFAYPMTVKTSWSHNHIPLTELFGIVINEDFNSGHNIMESEYMIEEWGLPKKQVLLAGDGHWWITLDYREGKTPSVRWIDCENNEDIHIAVNFEEFIEGLVDETVFDD